MEIRQINMNEMIEGALVNKLIYDIACMPGSHSFVAVEDGLVMGVAVISALTMGRGYALNYIEKVPGADMSLFGELLDAVEEYCMEQEAPEIRSVILHQSRDYEDVYRILANRGYEGALDEKHCFIYHLNDIEKMWTYYGVEEEKMYVIRNSVKSFDELTAGDIVSLIDKVGNGITYEDDWMEMEDYPYSKYFSFRGDMYGCIDVRELDHEVFMVQDAYRDVKRQKGLMIALLTETIETIKEDGYRDPVFIIPMALPDMEALTKECLGEPREIRPLCLASKKLEYIKQQEDTQYKIVFIQDPKVYQKFAPLFPEGTVYLDNEHFVFGAVDWETKTPIGVMAVASDENDLVIDYIYVREEYRGQMVGTMLFEEVRNLACERTIPFGIICSFDINNDDLFEFFYERPDMTLTKVGNAYRITPEELKESKLAKAMEGKSITQKTSIADFASDKEKVIQLLLKQIRNAEYDDFLKLNLKLSQVYVKNKEIKALLLVRDVDEDVIEIFYSWCKDEASKTGLYTLIQNAYLTYCNECPDKNIKVTITKSVIDITKIFPEIQSVGGVCIARWNYDNY